MSFSTVRKVVSTASRFCNLHSLMISSHPLIITAILLLLIIPIAMAQGQTPTSPVPRPSLDKPTSPSSSVRGREPRFRLDNQPMMPDATDRFSSSPSSGRMGDRTGRTGLSPTPSAPTESKEKQEQPKEKAEPEKQPKPAKPKEESRGVETVTRTTGKASPPTTTTPTPATSAPAPAPGTTPPGPRTPSMITAGGPAPPTPTGQDTIGRGIKGLASRLSAGMTPTATQGFFDILFSRKLEYGELPDEGEPLTLPGPMSVGEFLEAIHLATNWNIIVSDEAKNVQMNFWIADKKPREALEVLRFHGLFYEYDEKTKFLTVYTKEEWLIKTFGELKPHEFKIKHADVSYIEAILASLLSGLGKMITDTRTGTIYVWDIDDNIKQMEKMVTELDIPLEKRIFTIKHAETADIESVLTSMLSPNGSLLVDARSGQIFVWDNPTILDKMEEVVAKLDIPLETRTFASVHVDVNNLSDAIQSMISERGVVQIDPRTNTLIVTDLPTRLDRIEELIKTLDIKLETRTWVIKYADIDFIADQIENLVPSDMGNVIVKEDTHQITVTALPSRLDEIDELIKTWDIKRKQVLIEAFIVEMDTQVERSLGIDWSYYGTSGSVPIVIHGGAGVKDIASPRGSGETMSIGQLPTPIPRFGDLTVDRDGNLVRPQLQTIQGKPVIDQFIGNNLALTLNYLDKQDKATILSSPRVVVQDGEEAVFENATRVPYISGTAGYPPTYYYRQPQDTTSGTTQQPYYYPYYYGYSYYGGYNRVEFIDVGTILSVAPRIADDNTILLDISAEDSSYKDKEIKAYDQTSTVPEKTIRHAETQLRVKSGETIVLGGLRRSRTSHLVSKTPLLGDIPLLGKLFRNPSRNARTDNLLIFITTTIVDENTHPEAELLTRAEDKISEDVRHQTKSIWGRMNDKAHTDRKAEIRVSVGINGTIFMGGQKVTIEELPKLLEEEKSKGKRVVLLRKAYRAPEEIVKTIEQIATQANMKIDYDYLNEAVVALPNSDPTSTSSPSENKDTTEENHIVPLNPEE